MSKANLKVFIVSSAILLSFGCSTPLKRIFGQLPKPKNEITIHQIVEYPRAKEIEKNIPAWNGQTVCINVNYYTHSSVIKKIELVPRKSGKFFDLKLFLNRKGRLHWMALSNEFKNRPMAFVINGVFYRSFIPRPLVGDYDDTDDSTYILIEGPFDKVTAEKLAKWAPINYQFYNKQDDEF